MLINHRTFLYEKSYIIKFTIIFLNRANFVLLGATIARECTHVIVIACDRQKGSRSNCDCRWRLCVTWKADVRTAPFCGAISYLAKKRDSIDSPSSENCGIAFSIWPQFPSKIVFYEERASPSLSWPDEGTRAAVEWRDGKWERETRARNTRETE